MRIFLILAVALTFVACSSKDKQTMEGEAKAAMADGKDGMAKAAEAKGNDAKGSMQAMSTTCTNGSDSRAVEVRPTESGGCELFYSKFGKEKSVASSGFGTKYCEEVSAKIVKNLKTAGFDCK